MASPPRPRSRSPRFYASLRDKFGTGTSRGLQREDRYTFDAKTSSYRSSQGISRYNNRSPDRGVRRTKSPEPDYSFTPQMVRLSLNDPARSGGSPSDAYATNKTMLPRYQPGPRTGYSSPDSNRTILRGEWPGPLRRRVYRSLSAPRSYTPTVSVGGPHTSSPEAVLAIPPRPLDRPGSASGRNGSPTSRSPFRLARPQSPPAAAVRRIHALDLMVEEPRRFGTGTFRDPRSASSGFSQAYFAQARRDNSAPARFVTREQSRVARRNRVAQLARSEALAMAARRRHLAPNRIRMRDNLTAQSHNHLEEDQERIDLDDAAGMLSDGEPSVPFRYPRQEAYEVYRYRGGPFYGEREFSPRRLRSGFNWECHPYETEVSDATRHYSEDRGSTRRGRDQFHSLTHPPHFHSVAEDQRYGVGGRRWVNPNPPGPDPPIVVQDVMDQNF